MKLGTQTGSLINGLLAGSRQTQPEVGMAATICGWTDRSPATVIAIEGEPGKRRIQVQDDTAKVPAGVSNAFTEVQTWTYERNPQGYVRTFRENAKGSWDEVRFNAETKRWAKTGGPGISLGKRERYFDPSF